MSAGPTVRELTAVAASPGVAIGRARWWRSSAPDDGRATAAEPEQEVQRLATARTRLKVELRAIQERLSNRVAPAQVEIFDVQIALLDDPEWIEPAMELIRQRGIAAGAALSASSEIQLSLLDHAEDEQVRARAVDLRDLTQRLRRLLSGGTNVAPEFGDVDVILIADDLAPADTAQLDLERVKGLVTAAGSRTSHTAILARALGVPALVGLSEAKTSIQEDVLVVLDGDRGRLLLQPSEEQLATARERQRTAGAARILRATSPRLSAAGTVTNESRQMVLMANVGSLDEVVTALEQGAEGVGLLRSEQICFDRARLPEENELYAYYRRAVELLAPHPVVIRTFDIGGDKPLPGLHLPAESNPFLGIRGLRLCLERPELFRPQLRALLRASAHGTLKIMFPFVTLPAEVREGRRLLAMEATALRASGTAIAAHTEVGIMLEVPAAMLMVKQFAREVDFFSIGTNDLVQYIFAADRTNASVSRWQQSLHPVILRLIDTAVRSAHESGRPISLCGEVAADVEAGALWLGLGLDALSMHPNLISPVRRELEQTTSAEAATLACDVITRETMEDVVEKLRQDREARSRRLSKPESLPE